MLESDKEYILELYRAYYDSHYKTILDATPKYESREWAFLTFDNTMIRHRKISQPAEMLEYLLEPPKGIYYSLSIYEDPTAEMQDKGRITTDLVFDLDADHILGVRARKVFRCRECDYIGPDETCPRCDLDAKPIFVIDDYTIEDVINELHRLVKRIENYFDVRRESIRLFFSGLRGFHLHIEEKPYIDLDDVGRIEIKDFLTLEGIDFSKVRAVDAAAVSIVWEELGRLASKANLTDTSPPILKDILNVDSKETLYQTLKKLDPNSSQHVLKVIKQVCGIHVDPAVVTDLSRLIRAPFSLHGKSSLQKAPLSLEDLDRGGGYVVAKSMVFIGRVEVSVKYMPSLTWGGVEYPEIIDGKAVLPESLAIYLVNTGLASGLKPILG